jgi:anti-sigma B factor antagonist
MKNTLFRRWPKNAALDDAWVVAGESMIRVVQGSEQSTVAVAGRVTVDSSPHLRSILLELIRRGKAALVTIDLSAVSYVDMSGMAILLEALKAARGRSVKLSVTGMSGQVRTLAEVAQLDAVFRAWGSEVEFR